eukprot:CAMPEP_0175075644 /NCGR_PEP_ID=MMETSP0052_2-20121109/22158_1 /TAXON_ID=51329 ORGANISM="Polytomella parva, Strain SAG 63-3" /NCGR_SAMPLE_ID=MMETSP0052_2 /ASSEMBLY_ACC=CAM_ASM_000194 /LENGTH=58 /DNA_ID=CAMNT_0016344439 /DNA_START=379 /DNA_END=552 /DNA_ORIENTATION=-
MLEGREEEEEEEEEEVLSDVYDGSNRTSCKQTKSRRSTPSDPSRDHESGSGSSFFNRI